jgi:hypothetical protein
VDGVMLGRRGSDLDLAVVEADSKRRLRSCRGPLHDASVEAKGTPVAGTGDAVVVQRPLMREQPRCEQRSSRA